MTSLRHRIIFSCLSIVGTAGLVSFSNPVAAAPVDGVRRAAVFAGDLDLRNAAGQATFARRVASVARAVCAEQTRAARPAELACRRDVLVQARRQAGLAEIAAN